VIAPRYWRVDDFSEGLARVSVKGEVNSVGYINHDGAFAIAPNLSNGYRFHEGRAAVILDGPCQIANGGSCGRAEFRPGRRGVDCRYAFIDKTGAPISDLRFDDAGDFSEGLAPVRIGQRWGYVDASGQIVIEPRFESAEPFSDGLAAVRANGRTGFIKHNGTFVIDPQFSNAESFSDGRALVSNATGEFATGEFWFIDKTGKPAFAGKFPMAASFAHGLAPVAYEFTAPSKGRYAWIDTSGKPVFTYRVD
jgi:hypothetical protein